MRARASRRRARRTAGERSSSSVVALVQEASCLRVPSHAAGEDERLRLGSRVGQATLNEQDVEALLHLANRSLVPGGGHRPFGTGMRGAGRPTIAVERRSWCCSPARARIDRSHALRSRIVSTSAPSVRASPSTASRIACTRARVSSAISPGPLEAEQGDVGDLACGRVLARRLAELLGRAGRVEDVVDDLEEKADLVGEGMPRGTRRLGHARDLERAADAGAEQPPGLQAVQRGEAFAVEVAVRP